MLINKRNREVQLQLPKDAKGASMKYVDLTTAKNPSATKKLTGNTINLSGFSVAVVDFDK